MEALGRNVRMIPANPMLTATGRPRNLKERVAAYCRVSTDELDQINSFNTQKTYYEQKINETAEWTMAGIFADEGISGTRMEKRTDFMRMLRACRAGKIDRILCKSLSRFARNTVDCLDTVRELKELGIAVYFEKENIDTLNQQGEFIITLFSSFAQAESESLSANVRMGKRMGFAKGNVIFRTDMMLGYVKDKSGAPIIEPEGAKTVRRIYAGYLAGMSLVQIRNELIAESIPTARGVKAWSCEVIQSILKNERYMGDALLQKYYKEGCLSKACRRNKGELPQYYVENNHEGIVTRELFKRVQSEIARRANRKKAAQPTGDRVKGKYSAQYALTERLICGECGTPYRRVTWTQNGVKRVVWRCISRLEYGKRYCHNSPTVDEYKLHTAIVEAINRILEDKDEIMTAVTEAIRAAFRADESVENTAALEKRLKDLKAELDSLLKAAMKADANSTELDSEFRRIADEQLRISEMLRQQALEHDAEESENVRLREILRSIQETPAALTKYDDMLVRRIVESVTLDSKEQITVSFGCGVEVAVAID